MAKIWAVQQIYERQQKADMLEAQDFRRGHTTCNDIWSRNMNTNRKTENKTGSSPKEYGKIYPEYNKKRSSHQK